MKKIIKFGTVQPQYKIKCDKCGCIFTYDDEDVDYDYDIFTDQLYKSIVCPTCQKSLFLYPKILRSDRTNEV